MYILKNDHKKRRIFIHVSENIKYGKITVDYSSTKIKKNEKINDYE